MKPPKTCIIWRRRSKNRDLDGAVGELERLLALRARRPTQAKELLTYAFGALER